MGVTGLSKAIGPGESVALATLTQKSLMKNGRPLRIAIDISIWLYEAQKSQGGSNPQLRLLYFRFVRLLRAIVQPIFVFDGSRRPSFKRNKRTKVNHNSRLSELTKQLISIFGFNYHQAPGEAEAECALLQKRGLVDVVLSEDIDTLMFGCTLRLRSLVGPTSDRGVAFSKLSLFDLEKIKQAPTQIDCEGMILIALMSGGDYHPEGIPGCGIKVACEAARAGYGRRLYKLSDMDLGGIAAWRNDLRHQLRTNEKGFFRTKHPSLVIPEEFPDLDVLSYYRDPVISSKEELGDLEGLLDWEKQVDVPTLFKFVVEHFKWGDEGSTKFFRLLAPALVISKMWLMRRNRGEMSLSPSNDGLVESLGLKICGERLNPLDNSISEIRLSFQAFDAVLLQSLPSDTTSISRKLSHEDIWNDVDSYELKEPARLWVDKSYIVACLPDLIDQYQRTATEKTTVQGSRATSKGKRTREKAPVLSGPMDRYIRSTQSSASRTTVHHKSSNISDEESSSLPGSVVDDQVVSSSRVDHELLRKEALPREHTKLSTAEQVSLNLFLNVTKNNSHSTHDCQKKSMKSDSTAHVQFHTRNPTSSTSLSHKNHESQNQKRSAIIPTRALEDFLPKRESFAGLPGKEFNRQEVQTQRLKATSNPSATQDSSLTSGAECSTSSVSQSILVKSAALGSCFEAAKISESSSENRLSKTTHRRIFVARQSLEGSWKDIDDETYQELGNKQAGWYADQVAEIDLTRDDS